MDKRDQLVCMVRQMEALINRQNKYIRSLQAKNLIHVSKLLMNKANNRNALPGKDRVFCNVCNEWCETEKERVEKHSVSDVYCCTTCEPKIKHPVLRQLVAERKYPLLNTTLDNLTAKTTEVNTTLEKFWTELKSWRLTAPLEETPTNQFKPSKRRKIDKSFGVDWDFSEELNKSSFEDDVEGWYTYTEFDAQESINRLKKFYLLYGRTYQTFIHWEYCETIRQIRKGASMSVISGIYGIKLKVVKKYVHKYDDAPGNVLTGGRQFITTQEEDKLILKLSSYNASLAEIANFLEIGRDTVYARLRRARQCAERGDLIPKVKPEFSESESECDLKLQELSMRNELFCKNKSFRKKVCPFCKLYVYIPSLEMHIRCYHEQLQPVPCDICDRGFKTGQALATHHRDDHRDTSIPPNPEAVQCHHCDKKYANKNNLKSHLIKVFGAQHECPHCDMVFEREAHLKRHKKDVHPELMMFTCEKCGISFAKHYLYKAHCTTHTGIRPFSCHICSKRYSARCYLLKHIRTRHPKIEPVGYGCIICGETCATGHALYLHMKQHEQEK